MALNLSSAQAMVAPGVMWISIAFAAVLALGRSWHREREESALIGLLVSPLRRSSIFAGKAIGILLFLITIELLVIPTTALLFALDLPKIAPGLLLISLFATPGIAATGTLFGAMTARTRARDLILAAVLFPLLAPTLLTAVAATRELVSGTMLIDLGDFLLLFGALVEG
jgi:heme exporter protein B